MRLLRLREGAAQGVPVGHDVRPDPGADEHEFENLVLRRHMTGDAGARHIRKPFGGIRIDKVPGFADHRLRMGRFDHGHARSGPEKLFSGGCRGGGRRTEVAHDIGHDVIDDRVVRGARRAHQVRRQLGGQLEGHVVNRELLVLGGNQALAHQFADPEREILLVQLPHRAQDFAANALAVKEAQQLPEPA